MNSTLRARLPAVFVLLTLLAWFAPAYARAESQARGRPRPRHPAPSIAHRLDLYSPRVRHSTLIYLKLRLLELREEGLDRARAAVERELSIDDLLAPPRRWADKTPRRRPRPAEPAASDDPAAQ